VTGSYPINKGESVVEAITSTTTEFTITTGGSEGLTLSLYKNAVLVDSETVTFTGVNTFTSVTYVSTDALVIELT
jgi:hypothetical protein